MHFWNSHFQQSVMLIHSTIHKPQIRWDAEFSSRCCILPNTAYQAYKHRESTARSFRVLPSSEIYFLVTTSQGAEFIVTIPHIALIKRL